MGKRRKQQSIHVLYILTKLELGGAQKVCLSLYKGLESHGCGVSLISGNEGVLVSEVAAQKNVFLLSDFKREINFKLLIHELKAFFKIYKIIKRLKRFYPDLIVHTHSSKAGLLGRWAAFFARVKQRIHTIHGYSFHDFQPKIVWFGLYFIELLTSFVTTHYVCVSEKDRTFGIEYIPFFTNKSSVIRAAVDWDRFYIPASKNVDAGQGKPLCLIGTVGCFKPQKNLFDLLQAFKLIIDRLPLERRATVGLQIIGDGVMRLRFEKWLIEHDMVEYVELVGWQNDVASWMKNWDIFAMSSLWEGLPCAVVEARLCKLPVVAYRIGGIPEVIIDGENGFIVEPGNWHRLAEKLWLLITNQELRKTIGSYQDNLHEFNDSIMIQRHVDLYKGISKDKIINF